MSEQAQELTADLLELLSDATLSIFFAEGNGLGAFLLALIAYVFIRSRAFNRLKLSNLIHVLQKVRPPSE